MKTLYLITLLLCSTTVFSQYTMQGVVKGDCNEKKLILVNENNDVFSLVISDASKKFQLCQWVNWTASKESIIKEVALLVGLTSTTTDFALLSFSGDCNNRVFNMYNKNTKEKFQVAVSNNCQTINFSETPAEIAKRVCEVTNSCPN